MGLYLIICLFLHLYGTFFSFRMQSYEKIPKFASNFSLNKIKNTPRGFRTCQNTALSSVDCKMQITKHAS